LLHKDFSLSAAGFKKQKNVHKEKEKPVHGYLTQGFLSSYLTKNQADGIR